MNVRDLEDILRGIPDTYTVEWEYFSEDWEGWKHDAKMHFDIDELSKKITFSLTERD